MSEQNPIGILNPLELPKDSVALTRNGRTFTKAAINLQQMQQRRRELLQEYTELYRTKLNPLLEEIIRCHATIDEIIHEMSQS